MLKQRWGRWRDLLLLLPLRRHSEQSWRPAHQYPVAAQGPAHLVQGLTARRSLEIKRRPAADREVHLRLGRQNLAEGLEDLPAVCVLDLQIDGLVDGRPRGGRGLTSRRRQHQELRWAACLQLPAAGDALADRV